MDNIQSFSSMQACNVYQKDAGIITENAIDASAFSDSVQAQTQGQAPIRSNISGTDFLPNSTVSCPSLRITMQGTLMTWY